MTLRTDAGPLLTWASSRQAAKALLAAREEAGRDKASVSAACGWPANRLGEAEAGITRLRAGDALALAAELGVDPAGLHLETVEVAAELLPAGESLRVAKLLKKARLASGVSQEAAGRAIGCSQVKVSLWENLRRRMTRDEALAFAAAVGLSTEDLGLEEPVPAETEIEGAA